MISDRAVRMIMKAFGGTAKDGGPGSGPQPGGGSGEADFSPVTEAKRKWEGAYYKHAKNPSHTTRTRLEIATKEYEKLKAKHAQAKT